MASKPKPRKRTFFWIPIGRKSQSLGSVSCLFSRFFAFGFGIFFAGCGINTDTPVAPFVFFVPVSVPQIFSVAQINANISNSFEPNLETQVLDPRPEFLVRYFITNREPQFVGYNLYITSAVPGVVQTISGEWLEDGVQPSFPSLPFQNSTESRNLVTRRIRYLVPPPNLSPFQKCQVYNFTMRALLNNGLLSNPSAPVAICSKGLQPLSFCTPGSACNPTICNDANCSSPLSCPVSTLCNPCTIFGKENLGCPCPAGSKGPGCNPVGNG